jgi:hypothetical protein
MRPHLTIPRSVILAALALLTILAFAALAGCGGDGDNGYGGNGSPTASGTSSDATSAAATDGSNGTSTGNDGGTDDGTGGGTPGGTDGGTDGGSDGGTDGNSDGGTVETFERLTVTLQPVGGSSVGGTAQLTPVNAGTQVTIEIAAGLPGGSHAAMLHLGSCTNLGETKFYLAELVGPGSADSTTLIPSDAEQTPPPPPAGQYTPEPGTFIQFIAQDYVLAIHAGPTTDPGAVIACGAVEEP